ncbi:hypothetical protein C4J81_00580 [Deltaproteobacteria bacterium Smac51]|nr:hypothetical protein C4J81_00580 [Deltaproteobacteria bacterium Smac51]
MAFFECPRCKAPLDGDLRANPCCNQCKRSFAEVVELCESYNEQVSVLTHLASTYKKALKTIEPLAEEFGGIECMHNIELPKEAEVSWEVKMTVEKLRDIVSKVRMIIEFNRELSLMALIGAEQAYARWDEESPPASDEDFNRIENIHLNLQMCAFLWGRIIIEFEEAPLMMDAIEEAKEYRQIIASRQYMLENLTKLRKNPSCPDDHLIQ